MVFHPRRLLLLVSLSACGMRSFEAGTGPGLDEEGTVSVRLEPAVAEGETPRVVRAHIASMAPIDPARLFWFDGTLGSGHAKQLERDELSSALEGRVLPSIVFDGEAGETVVAPLVTFVADEPYALGGGAPAFAQNLVATDVFPVLPRVWPPPAEAASGSLAIHCGDPVLPPMDRAITLDPGGISAQLARGAVDGVGARCVRIDVLGEVTEPVLPPLSVDVEGQPHLLEPAPIAATVDEAPPVASRDCAPGEVPFGPGCAVVEDDRLIVHAPESALFWAVSAPTLELAAPIAAGGVFALRPLAPGAAVMFHVATVDVAGATSRSVVGVTTRAPAPHFVLTEVLANPLGAEPAQELVELVNDGLVAGDLAGYALEDGGGSTVLPSVVVAPGQWVLVVREDFVEDDGVDPPPAPGTVLVRVPTLGKGGLANGGEPLALRAPDGRIVSRAPPLPKPAAGESLTRRDLASPDDGPDAFVRASPTPGAFANE